MLHIADTPDGISVAEVQSNGKLTGSLIALYSTSPIFTQTLFSLQAFTPR